jgi:hypothetical protein
MSDIGRIPLWMVATVGGLAALGLLTLFFYAISIVFVFCVTYYTSAYSTNIQYIVFLSILITLSLFIYKKSHHILKLRVKKYKDLMSALKDGKVQKDMKFSHFFHPNIFLNLARKDSVRLTEKEIEKLTKEISLLKNRYEVYKNEIHM